MPPPHNGVCLSEKMYTLFCEWEIQDKLFALTLDNASANIVSVELLISQWNISKALVCGGSFFHLRCCAHILNLIVQDGLKQLDESVEKIRESIKYVKGSQTRKQKFQECVKHMGIDARKGLRQDVPTRWNSTFLMLESALFYRRAFLHLELSDSNYTACPSRVEWEKIEKICKFLSVFYETTCIFSETKYPTANLYFPSVSVTYLTLKQHLDSEDEYLKNMATKMMEKFKKYWDEFSVILAIAVVLDPRYKLQFVDFSYKKFYGVSGSMAFVEVKDNLFRLFDEYASKNTMAPSTSTLSERGIASGFEIQLSGSSGDFIKEFEVYESEEVTILQKSQLELYFDEPKVGIGSKFDILSYWKANQYRYPELASMARDVLSIPVSTVASESAFSVGGHVIDQYRSSLKPDVVDALVCTRDWLFGDKELMQLKLNELIEDVLNLDLNGPKESPSPSTTECSNSVNLN